jgi:hypothetical protein
MAGTTLPLRVKIDRPRIEGLHHLSTAQISLAGIPTARRLDPLKSLNCRLQGIFASAQNELLKQRMKPVRRVSQDLPICSAGAVKHRVAGTQQRQAPVPRRFRFGEGEEGLGQ